MVYALQITKTANKQLDKLPYKVQEQIRTSLIELSGNPYAASLDIKKLKNQSYYRLRVGSYRVIYELRNEVLIILVMEVWHRQSAY